MPPNRRHSGLQELLLDLIRSVCPQIRACRFDRPVILLTARIFRCVTVDESNITIIDLCATIWLR